MKVTHHKQVGFTLIELMITVFIIAIVAAIAIPSYRQYIQKTHQDKIRSLLMNYSIQMEKWRAKTLSYAGFTPTDLKVTNDALGDLESDSETVNYPANSTGNNIIYKITIDSVTGSTTPTFSPLKTSTIATRWAMLAIPQDSSTGMVSIGITSTGIKCQNKSTNIAMADVWAGTCGTGGTTW